MNVRVACAQVIAAVLQQQGSLNSLLPDYSSQVPNRDRSLLQELCFGTLRWYPRLDLILAALLSKPLSRRDMDIQALLASAIYQITEMRVPSHAAVNEAVTASKQMGKPWARGLVNAVLRRYLREQKAIHQSLASNPVFASALPDWMLQQLRSAWPEQLENIIAATNGRAPMTLRVNRAQISAAHYLEQLTEAGIPAVRTSLSAVGIQLLTPVAVDQLPGFNEGLVSVQDEGAQLAGTLLDIRPGQRVLDACSAPGGKTCHLLEMHPDLGCLLALDIDTGRLQRVRENLERLGLRAELQTADAACLDDWWDGIHFDHILLDAPCSGSGVIRRHPDIKVLRRPTDIDKLGEVQSRLLTQLWKTLRPGGRLLYATCSILPAENQALTEQFCREQVDCVAPALAASWGTAAGSGRQLLPVLDGHDGFFYTLLQKQEK